MGMSIHGSIRELSPVKVQREMKAHTIRHTLRVDWEIHDPSEGDFQISFVEFKNSYSCASCSGDICIKQLAIIRGFRPTHTFSNTVGSNLFPL